MVYLVPKKTTWPCVMLMRPSTRGIAGRAAQPQVGLHLQVLRQRALQLDVGRGLDLDVEVHAAQQAGARRGRLHRLGGFRQISELKSDCGLKPVRRMVMVPESMLRSVVPVRFRLALATVLTPSG